MSTPHRPRLQLALDLLDIEPAVQLTRAVGDHVDVLEAGTILILNRGLHVVERLRAVWGKRPLVADVRIVEAGAIIADMAFSAGADVVTVFGGTSDTAIASVAERARDHGKRVQIEVFEEWSYARAKLWRALGIDELVLHRSRDAERDGIRAWGEADRTKIVRAAALGFEVSVTGGVTCDELKTFAGLPVAGFIVGRAIGSHSDPAAAARALQDAITATFGQ